jgi:nitroimidazol reductase NimA-like FMN-containing flavoprotein (pyridoxamine 5'-phosphate oxidase superfamily)
MTETNSVRTALENLLKGQMLAALATWGDGRPYSSLVAFRACDNGKRLLFVTPKSTRKYSNLVENPYVAMLVDNRSNDISDFSEAMAATADGKAHEADPAELDRFMDLYLGKHPNLDSFAKNSHCSLFVVEVEVYHVVTRFQKVVNISPWS